MRSSSSRNVYRHIEEGTAARPGPALIGCPRDRRAGDRHDHHAGPPSMAPDRPSSAGLTGALFPRGSPSPWPARLIISGIVAITLSPMMCSLLLTKEMVAGSLRPPGRPRLLRGWRAGMAVA